MNSVPNEFGPDFRDQLRLLALGQADPLNAEIEMDRLDRQWLP